MILLLLHDQETYVEENQGVEVNDRSDGQICNEAKEYDFGILLG